MSTANYIFSTSMSCGSCLAKLQPVLDSDSGVLEWKVDLDDPRKLLFVESLGLEASQIIAMIAQAGFEASELSERSLVNLEGQKSLPAKQPFRLSTYWPLLLVLAYVVGMASLTEWAHTEFSWRRWMSYFMGFFFLGFAFFKLLSVSKFAKAFASYDILARRVRIYGLAYPFIEVGLGMLFVTQTGLTVANVATVLLMAVGLVGVIIAVFSEREIQCACLGTVFQLPMSVVTIVENSVMLLMAISMLVI